ncbi:DNA mismatch repair endonuclease MutL [Mycoplasmatota bacterium]|nr:DNA mismatch repair endonuclease MutL [Mycoplasmatota bacterium]
MGKIQVMNSHLANKIAAGEVVERPSSVVKELVENAIDANSTKIDIILEESGIKSIKVIDNGLGMDKEDALLAFSRHATSKLTKEQDLFRIMTLGFRGEALPSIASVSDITLMTSNGVDSGTKVHFRGGKLIEEGLAAFRKGTEISVNQLFFNTPARLKYLKSENTELSYTIDFINKIAISNPQISFKLMNNQRVLLETYGNNNIIQVLSSIYGIEVAKKIKTETYKDNYLDMKLYFSEPEVNRTTRNYITVIINKRMIKNNEIIKAVLAGYESYLPIKRYPIVVLDITIDPLLVDVNVHPSKLEVRLSNQEHIKTVITDIIQKKLKELMYIPKVTFRKEISDGVKEEQQQFDLKEQEKVNADDYFNHSEIKSEYQKPKELKPEKDLKLNQTFPYQKEVPGVINGKNKLPKLYYIGQLAGTYLLAQNEIGLYMIDQHAAQERVNYEMYLKHFSQPIHEYYELLVPLTFDFSLNEALIIEENLNLLTDMNIMIEKFGLSSFIVHKIPNYLNKGNESEIIKTIFDFLIHHKKLSNDQLFKELAITLSCKRSIKANHYINELEIEKLIRDLEKCDNPYTCPHGRPVLINLSFNEIEHLFKRTM